MTLPEPIRRYLTGNSSLENAVRELQDLFPDGAFNFSPADVGPAEMVKVMELMKAYGAAGDPDAAEAVADLDPQEMARIVEHMRKFGRPPAS